MAEAIKGYTHRYANRAAAETGTLLVTGSGYLGGVVVNKGGAAFTILVYDGLDAATGTLIATIIPGATGVGSLRYDCRFNVGLYLVSSGASHGDYTITYEEM